MPKIKIPAKSKNWVISYLSPYLGDLIRTQSVTFDYPVGSLSLSFPIQSHTVTQNIAAIVTPTRFQRSNFNGTDSYWAVAEKLYVVSNTNFSSTNFAADALTNSPTSISDGDMVLFGKCLPGGSFSGRDVAVVSDGGTDLTIFNRDVSSGWIKNWWTGLTSTISATNITIPVQITTSSAHGYSTNDVVLISGNTPAPVNISASTNATPIQITTSASHGFQTNDQVTIANHNTNTNANGTWTITYVDPTNFTLNNSVGNGVGGATGTATCSDTGLNTKWKITKVDATNFTLNGSLPHGPSNNDGTVVRIFDFTNSITTLGQLALSSGPHPMLSFGGTTPLLFIADANNVHSIATNTADYTGVNYKRLVFPAKYTINWMVANAYKIYIGLKDATDLNRPSLVEEYDPFNEQVREFSIHEGSTIGFIDNNNLHIVDIKGQVRIFDGNQFTVYANFPCAFSTDTVTIHRNGIIKSGKFTHFLIPSSSATMHGGVWRWSPDLKSLYHRAGPIVFHTTQKTFESPKVSVAGALFPINAESYLAGLSTSEDTSTDCTGIFSNVYPVNGAGPQRGFIETARLEAEEINQIWRNILIKYLPQNPSSGTSKFSIVVKYKTTNPTYSTSSPISGTWVTDTTFTTASNTGAAVGDEISFWRGNGAGTTAHIVSITGPVAGVYTYTIDEAPITGASGGFEFFLDTYQKLGTITDTTQQSALLEGPGLQTEWIQFKIELRDDYTGGNISNGPILEAIQVGVNKGLTVEN